MSACSAAAQQLIDSVTTLATSLGPSADVKATRKQAESTLKAIDGARHKTFVTMDAAASAKTIIKSALMPMFDRVDSTDLSVAVNQARLATGLHHIAHQLRPLAAGYQGGPCAMPRELDVDRLNVARTAESDSKTQCASEAVRHDAPLEVFGAALPFAASTMFAEAHSFPCGVNGAGPVTEDGACAVGLGAHPGAQEAYLETMIRPPLSVSGGELHEPWDK